MRVPPWNSHGSASEYSLSSIPSPWLTTVMTDLTVGVNSYVLCPLWYFVVTIIPSVKLRSVLNNKCSKIGKSDER